MKPLPTVPNYAGKCALEGALIFWSFGICTAIAQMVVLDVPFNEPAAHLVTFALTSAFAVVGFGCGAYWSLRAAVQRLREIHAALQIIAETDAPTSR